MSLRRAITLLPAIAGALALFGSGCGASATALDPVAQAAEATSKAGGAHMALAIQFTSAGLATPFTLSGGGFFNYRTQEGTLTLEASGLPASASAVLPPGRLRIEELFKSETVYMSSPLLDGHLPGGAHWLKLDVGRFAQAAGLDLRQLAGGKSNPAQFLQYLRAISGAPQALGSELVRGVQTTHYHATVDLSKVASALSASQSSQLRSALAKLIAQAGTSRVPVDVWVDGRGLVRRLALAMTLATGARQAQFGMTLELFDFGPTPAVAPPPASEVFDATQAALGSLGALGAGG